MKFFVEGFKKMTPVMTGIIPFGAVMGTICAEAQLTLFQSLAMNILVFAGTAQMAAIDLMSKNAASAVILATGLIINLRFLLYSAALSPVLQKSNFLTKISSAYFLTDQTYNVMSAHQEKLSTNKEVIQFYFGAAICMALTWDVSVAAGYVFGNFAPKAFALDYAVPLSFVTLVVPTLKNKKYFYVAACSAACALLLKPLPFNLGLIISALLALSLALVLSGRKISI
jgi:predicted branched-subunit amino acid permease